MKKIRLCKYPKPSKEDMKDRPLTSLIIKKERKFCADVTRRLKKYLYSEILATKEKK